MSIKFFIKSLNRRLPAGILVLIFLLTLGFSNVTLSQDGRADEQNVLRRASLEWMQVGMEQYQSKQFSQAEQSFRRALVFQKYLTDAERNKLNKYLTNAHIAVTKGKQAVAIAKPADKSVKQDQPVKAAAKKAGRQETGIVLDKINIQPKQQKAESVPATEPSVSKIQLAAESPSDVIVVTDNSFRGKYMRLSSWLSENRRNFLIIGLPILAVLIFIMKLQGARKRPGRRVFKNPVPFNTSYIGVRLNDSKQDNNINKDSKNPRPAPASAANPKLKSFTQSTEHWKEKHAGHKPRTGKSNQTSEKWPGRKEKLGHGDSTVAKAGKKLCRKCNEMKDFSDFHKNKSSKDGLASWCKECKKQSRKKSV